MPVFRVNVKWGKEKFEGVQLNTDEPPIVFKMQLFSLTSVTPERQKVMVSGSTLGDSDWGKISGKVKNNMMLMLMGSADVIPQAPIVQPKFIEDMSETEAISMLNVPTGLPNLGNTCYMNATLQCLKCIPELKDAIMTFSMKRNDVLSHQLTSTLSRLYAMMEKGQSGLHLMMFLTTLHTVVPHFAKKDEQTGVLCQQDAHECWAAVTNNLSQALPPPSETGRSFMQHYFGLTMEARYKCLESEEEMESMETEQSLQLSCFVDQDVKYLYTGIEKGLRGTVEKQSPTLNRNAQYKKTSRLSRLPAYLTVQFVRFSVGKAGGSDEVVSRKILKDIKFPMKLDLLNFCTSGLQEAMVPIRSRFKDVEDKKIAAKAKQIAEGIAVNKQEMNKTLDYEPYSFDDDIGSNNSGYYELLAVLTHKGRSSSSGHYLAWVKKCPGEWLKYDDDEVSAVLEEDVLKLSGGGDWHTAYILVYGPQRLEKITSDSL